MPPIRLFMLFFGYVPEGQELDNDGLKGTHKARCQKYGRNQVPAWTGNGQPKGQQLSNSDVPSAANYLLVLGQESARFRESCESPGNRKGMVQFDSGHSSCFPSENQQIHPAYPPELPPFRWSGAEEVGCT